MKKINRLVLYIAAGLLIGEIFCKYNIGIVWGFILVPIIIVINVVSRKKKSEILLLILLFLVLLLVGSKLYNNKIMVLDEYDERSEGDEIIIEGEVSNIWKNKNGLTVEIKELKKGIKIVCYFTEFEYEIGRRMIIEGKKKELNESSNLGEFDLKKYYNSKEIFIVLEECLVRDVGDEYSEIFNGFYKIRQGLKKSIESMCDEEEAGVLCAMLFGDKEKLDGEIKDLYTMSGIGHIFTISGLHISLAGGFVYQFMRKFCRQPASFLVSSGIMLCFCGISGASVSTVRAVIMYIINIFSHVLGRKYDMKNAMAISLIWVLVDNPLYINNGGFVLSFLSVAGIAFVLPVLNEIFEERLNGKGIKIKIFNAVVTSVMFYMVTLMAVSFLYYEIPVYSIILNTLLLPMMGAIVISGFLGGMAFYIAEPLGEIVIMVSVIILKVYKLICSVFMKLPLNVYVTGSKSVLQVIIYYLILIGIAIICVVLKRKNRSMKIIISIISVGVAAMLILVLCRRQYCFNITILDVGQGDCIYVESPDGSNYLIDGGSTNKQNIGEYIIEPFLKYRGREELTAVFITHTDTDHISGIIELLENDEIEIKNIIFGAYMPEKSETYEKIIKLINDKGINIITIEEGDVIGDKRLEYICLNPKAEYDYEDINASSIVLLGKYDNNRFLLTGDIGEKEEKALIYGQYGNDLKNLLLLKSAHHGSKNSNSEDLLSLAKPEITVISCGINNSYGHPHKEALEVINQYSKYTMATKDVGMICIEERKRKIYVEIWRNICYTALVE